jgi:hypothetical protein
MAIGASGAASLSRISRLPLQHVEWDAILRLIPTGSRASAGLSVPGGLHRAELAEVLSRLRAA